MTDSGKQTLFQDLSPIKAPLATTLTPARSEKNQKSSENGVMVAEISKETFKETSKGAIKKITDNMVGNAVKITQNKNSVDRPHNPRRNSLEKDASRPKPPSKTLLKSPLKHPSQSSLKPSSESHFLQLDRASWSPTTWAHILETIAQGHTDLVQSLTKTLAHYGFHSLGILSEDVLPVDIPPLSEDSTRSCSLENSPYSSAFLIQGPWGVGKEYLVMYLAWSLLANFNLNTMRNGHEATSLNTPHAPLHGAPLNPLEEQRDEHNSQEEQCHPGNQKDLFWTSGAQSTGASTSNSNLGGFFSTDNIDMHALEEHSKETRGHQKNGVILGGEMVEQEKSSQSVPHFTADVLRVLMQIISGTHSNWISLPSNASIEDIREMVEKCHQTTLGPRVVHIPQGDMLSKNSINALLKILENPPKNTLFFITSTGNLLSTLQSRCLLFTMKPLDAAIFHTKMTTICQILEHPSWGPMYPLEKNSENASFWPWLWQGCLVRAMEMMPHTSWLETTWGFLNHLPHRNPVHNCHYCKNHNRQDAAKSVFKNNNLYSLGSEWMAHWQENQHLWRQLVWLWLYIQGCNKMYSKISYQKDNNNGNTQSDAQSDVQSDNQYPSTMLQPNTSQPYTLYPYAIWSHAILLEDVRLLMENNDTYHTNGLLTAHVVCEKISQFYQNIFKD